MRWALAAAALCAWGCAETRVPHIGEQARGDLDVSAESAYQAVLARHTTRKAIYDGLDTRLFIAATLQTPAFVEARVRRQGALKDAPPARVDEELAQERKRLDGVTEIFFGIHANDPRHDDFDRKPSMWRLALVAGGVEQEPLEVRRVGRGTVDLRALYPYLDTFWVGYAARFQGAPAAGAPLTFKVASSLGKAELEFRVE